MQPSRFLPPTLYGVLVASLLFVSASVLAQGNLPELDALGPEPTCNGVTGAELRVCKVQKRAWKIAERQIRWQARQGNRTERLGSTLDAILRDLRGGFRTPFLQDRRDRRTYLREGGSPGSFYEERSPELRSRIEQRRLRTPRRTPTPPLPARSQGLRDIRSSQTYSVQDQRRMCRSLPPREWQACLDRLAP
jgi:hypothetical protein